MIFFEETECVKVESTFEKELKSLEAFSVDDGGTGFVVFGLGDPHRLKRGE